MTQKSLQERADLSWAAISGKWEFEGPAAIYQEGGTSGFAGGRPVSLGVALTNQSLQDGNVRIRISFDGLTPDDLQGGGLVIG